MTGRIVQTVGMGGVEGHSSSYDKVMYAIIGACPTWVTEHAAVCGVLNWGLT